MENETIQSTQPTSSSLFDFGDFDAPLAFGVFLFSWSNDFYTRLLGMVIVAQRFYSALKR